MSNIPIPLSKTSMADWISDFVNSLNKNKEEVVEEIAEEIVENIVKEITDVKEDEETESATSQLKKAAEINIKDLPKIVWNDETFYVLFDVDSGKATILNEFTNVVTTIDAKSIEEVDELLNSKQVVAEKDSEFECELDKNLNDNTELLNKIAELQEQVETLSNEIIELREQQYARNQEQVNLDINVENAEIQHFNETSQQTQDSINSDNAVDITTPAGRTELSLKEKLLNELNQMDDLEEIEYDENEVELEDAPGIEDIDSIENPSEEAIVEEINSPVEENPEDDKLTNEFDEVAVLEEQNFEQTIDNEDSKLEDFSNEDEDKEVIKTLGSRDTKIFKNAICPVCGDELVKANKVGSFQGIVCKGECKSEFAINLDTEEIFRK